MITTYWGTATTISNVYAGIGASKWAYTEKNRGVSEATNAHGAATPGDKLIIFKQNGDPERRFFAVGDIMSWPEIGKIDDETWNDGPYFDQFDVNFTHKGFIWKKDLHKIFGNKWHTDNFVTDINRGSSITPQQFVDLISLLNRI